MGKDEKREKRKIEGREIGAIRFIDKRNKKEEDAKMKLSCCMMVKNEEKLLEGALASVVPHVHETILVDTGSTDGTVEVAKRFNNIKIFREPWGGDFSAMRNKTIEKAAGDWILILDADERVETMPWDFLANIGVTFDLNAVGFYIGIKNELRDGAVSESKIIRIFRNGLGFKFTGRIHNQLTISGPVRDLSRSSAIRHLGYGLPPAQIYAKYVARVGILLDMKAKDPDDAMIRYWLSKMYIQGGAYGFAESEAKEAIEMLRGRDGFIFRGTPFDELFEIARIEKGKGE